MPKTVLETLDPSTLPVLVLAPTGGDSHISCKMLGRAQLPCIVCKSSQELFLRMRQMTGPVMIAAEALDAEEAASLLELLEAQPPWSDIPLFIFSSNDQFRPSYRPLAARRSTTLLYRPIRVPMFISLARAAMQSRLRQYQVRDLLRSLQDRAAQLQRLAFELTIAEERERDRIAQLLHDDLQQILVAAQFRLHLLPMETDGVALEDSVKKTTLLIQQAIQSSRALSHDLSPPTLRQHGLVAALRWQAERMLELHGLHVKLDCDPLPEPARALLNTLLFNFAQELLFNVVKHAGTKEAHLSLRLKGDIVELCVRDEGSGFNPSILLDAFRAPGLGLLSMRERTDLLGGRLEIVSAPGAGSTFSLYMPLEPPPMGTEANDRSAESVSVFPAATTEPGKAPTPRLRVALVDDHLVMRSGLKAFLSNQEGIEVIAEADNGLEALEVARRFQPDLILMDVSMPKMDGIEATRRIKESHPEIRIIGLSMFDDHETAAKMAEAGVERYLSKAGSGENLLHAVRGSHTTAPEEATH